MRIEDAQSMKVGSADVVEVKMGSNTVWPPQYTYVISNVQLRYSEGSAIYANGTNYAYLFATIQRYRGTTLIDTFESELIPTDLVGVGFSIVGTQVRANNRGSVEGDARTATFKGSFAGTQASGTYTATQEANIKTAVYTPSLSLSVYEGSGTATAKSLGDSCTILASLLKHFEYTSGAETQDVVYPYALTSNNPDFTIDGSRGTWSRNDGTAIRSAYITMVADAFARATVQTFQSVAQFTYAVKFFSGDSASVATIAKRIIVPSFGITQTYYMFLQTFRDGNPWSYEVIPAGRGQFTFTAGGSAWQQADSITRADASDGTRYTFLWESPILEGEGAYNVQYVYNGITAYGSIDVVLESGDYRYYTQIEDANGNVITSLNFVGGGVTNVFVYGITKRGSTILKREEINLADIEITGTTSEVQAVKQSGNIVMIRVLQGETTISETLSFAWDKHSMVSLARVSITSTPAVVIKHPVVDSASCVGCGNCYDNWYCEQGVVLFENDNSQAEFDYTDCTACGDCESLLPDLNCPADLFSMENGFPVLQ